MADDEEVDGDLQEVLRQQTDPEKEQLEDETYWQENLQKMGTHLNEKWEQKLNWELQQLNQQWQQTLDSENKQLNQQWQQRLDSENHQLNKGWQQRLDTEIETFHKEYNSMKQKLEQQLEESKTNLNSVIENKNQLLHEMFEKIEEQKAEIDNIKEINRLQENDINSLDKELQKANNKLRTYRENEEKEKAAQKERERREREMRTKTEVYLHLADQSYERDYLPIMETILCDLFNLKNPEDIYHKKKVHRYGEIGASSSSSSFSSSNTLPPPGSTVLYVLFLTSNRFDDFPKKQFLANLITNQVNVIVCLFRRARGAYLDVEEIVAGNGIPVLTIPFMVNQKRLAHEVSDLSTKEKDSLEPGYANSLHNLQCQLLEKPTPQQTILGRLKSMIGR